MAATVEEMEVNEQRITETIKSSVDSLNLAFENQIAAGEGLTSTVWCVEADRERLTKFLANREEAWAQRFHKIVKRQDFYVEHMQKVGLKVKLGTYRCVTRLPRSTISRVPLHIPLLHTSTRFHTRTRTSCRQQLKLISTYNVHNADFRAMMDGADYQQAVAALRTLSIDYSNITQAIKDAKPADVVALEQELAEKRAAAIEAAKASSPSDAKAAAALMAEEGEAEEEDDTVCISRRPPLTHNLTHSTPHPPPFCRCPTSPTRSRMPPWMVRAAAASPRRRRPRR